MAMKYFSKYLPNKGEQKSIIFGKPLEQNNGGEPKLFLCSKNIESGDHTIVHWEDGVITWEIANKINFWKDSELAYKIIGEISPEATWVKEGDEFDEEDWEYYTDIITGENNTIESIQLIKKPPFVFPVIIKIKCPTCKHFH